MRILAAVLSLLLLPVSAFAQSSCALKQLASLPMQITDANGIVVTVDVGGEKLPFILDTRLVRTVVFRGTVDRLNLPYAIMPERPLDIDSTLSDGWTRVPGLMIGGMSMVGYGFAVTANSNDGTAGRPAGVIGADILWHNDVEIDPANHRLNIYSQDHCAGKVVYWADSYYRSNIHVYANGQAEMDVDLDGQLLHAVLATGAGSTVIEERSAQRRFGIDSDGLAQAQPIVDLQGKLMPVVQYDFKALKFGDLTIHNPKIGIAPVHTPWVFTGSHLNADLSPDVLVGMNTLRHLHAYIAYGEDKIYYTVVD